jgi:hypothetical protein
MAKTRNLENAKLINENVLRAEITHKNRVAMDMLECLHEIRAKALDRTFWKRSFLFE